MAYEQPSGRTGHVAVFYKNCMLVWGGYKEAANVNNNRYLPGSELWIYDPLTEKWLLKICHGTPPPGTSGATAVMVSDYMYLFGGYCDNGNTNDLYRLNLETLEWTYIEPKGSPPTPSDKMVGWEYKDKLYFFGEFGVLPTFGIKKQPDFQFVLDPTTPWMYRRGWNNQLVMFDTEKGIWSWPEYNGPVPDARAAHAACRVGHFVYIFGGRHQHFRQNDTHRLNLETMTWSGKLSTLGPQPQGRSWHSLTTISQDVILLYGGFSQHNEPLSDCWQLNLSTLTWLQVDLSFTKPRLWHTACLTSYGEVIIYGGCTENILNRTIVAEHASNLIILRFSPKTLFRLSLDRIIQYNAILQPFWSMLPYTLQAILNLRMSSGRHTSLGGS
ncbi:kelch domain-containing protein 2-like [Centruroides vittatus]|uniref:kelch domain-containing protein 2-like n=1 Tax=Centruroides vittatus TaxID=120091 RepID=UPI0035107DDE